MRATILLSLCLLACNTNPRTAEPQGDTAAPQPGDSIVIMNDSGFQKKKLISAPVDTTKLKNSRAMRVLQKANGD